MERLLNLTLNEVAVLGLACVIVLTVIGCILRMITRFMKDTHATKLSFGKAILEADYKKSPEDTVKFPHRGGTVDLAGEIYTDHMGHMYFLDLRKTLNVGPQVHCQSKVKEDMIKVFIRVYTQALINVIGRWVRTVSADESHSLDECRDGILLDEVQKTYNDLAAKERIVLFHNGKRKSHVGIPEILTAKFNEEYSVVVSGLVEQFQRIIDDEHYHATWSDKVTGILDALDTSYRRDFCALNGFVQCLNGELVKYFETEFIEECDE